MPEEKILTLHPEPGKAGVNISKAKYDLIRQMILDLRRRVPNSHPQLVQMVAQ